MNGEYRGVQAEIKTEAGGKAVCTHFYNHVLALVLERSASDIPLVVQIFTWLSTAYKFLKHYKVLVLGLYHITLKKQMQALTGLCI